MPTFAILPPTREQTAAWLAASRSDADAAKERLGSLRKARAYADSALAVIDGPDGDLRAAAEAFSAALDAALAAAGRAADDAVWAFNVADGNARRIDKLTPGQVVELRFGKRFTAANEFVGISGEGERRRATFRSVSGDDRLPVSDWEAYRYNGSWCYGSSAERLSIVVDL